MSSSFIWEHRFTFILFVTLMFPCSIAIQAACEHECPDDPTCYERDPYTEISLEFAQPIYEVEGCCEGGTLTASEAVSLLNITYTASDMDKWRDASGDYYEQDPDDCTCDLIRDPNYTWHVITNTVEEVAYQGTVDLETAGVYLLELAVHNTIVEEPNGCYKTSYESAIFPVYVHVVYPDDMTHPADPAQRPEGGSRIVQDVDHIVHIDEHTTYWFDQIAYWEDVTYPIILEVPNGSCNQQHSVSWSEGAEQGSSLTVGGTLTIGIEPLKLAITAETGVDNSGTITITVNGSCAAEPCVYNGLDFWQRQAIVDGTYREVWVDNITQEITHREVHSIHGFSFGPPVPRCYYRLAFEDLPGSS